MIFLGIMALPLVICFWSGYLVGWVTGIKQAVTQLENEK